MSEPVILKSIKEVREWHKSHIGKALGFVPTMGALHDGHIGLVKEAKEHSELVIVSIFVNPSQFAPGEDLDKYPRDVEGDILKLRSLASAVFLPSVEEIYPSGITLDINKQTGTFIEVLGKSHQLEGSIRPHFFRGVATVVSKLLNIVQPDFLFLGQKDAQQCVVVKTMINDLCFNTKLIICPIAREPSGLAMSSRNQYLDSETRTGSALALYKALLGAEKTYKNAITKREQILFEATKVIEGYEDVMVDYISLSNPITLEEIQEIGSQGALLSGAIRVGPSEKSVRLIDNILLGAEL